MLRTTKPPRCKVCRTRLDQLRPGQVVHETCVEEYVRRLRAEKAERARKADRAATKAARERMKTAKDLKPEAQEAFNRYIRLRDHHLPCVSCGETDPPMTPGGQWDAGHFKSRGSHPELAFDEDNCHKQCKTCNGGSAYTKHNERVVSARYEEELLRRIGPERVARLNGPHAPAKRTADDFRALRDHYREQARRLLAQRKEEA